MAQKIQMRRDTLDNWTEVNPILARGEWGVAFNGATIVSIKMGDGETNWVNLESLIPSSTGLDRVNIKIDQGVIPLNDPLWAYVNEGSYIWIVTTTDAGIYIKDPDLDGESVETISFDHAPGDAVVVYDGVYYSWDEVLEGNALIEVPVLYTGQSTIIGTTAKNVSVPPNSAYTEAWNANDSLDDLENHLEKIATVITEIKTYVPDIDTADNFQYILNTWLDGAIGDAVGFTDNPTNPADAVKVIMQALHQLTLVTSASPDSENAIVAMEVFS